MTKEKGTLESTRQTKNQGGKKRWNQREEEKKIKTEWKEGEKIKSKDPDQKVQRTKCMRNTTIEISKFQTPIICMFSILILRKYF